MHKYNPNLVEMIAKQLHAESDNPSQWDFSGLHTRCDFRDEAVALLDKESARVWDETEGMHAEYRADMWDYDHGYRDSQPEFPENPYA